MKTVEVVISLYQHKLSSKIKDVVDVNTVFQT